MSIANKPLLFSILFGIFLLSILLLRIFTNGNPIGEEAYYHLRIANTFQEKGFIHNDELSYGLRTFLSERLPALLILPAPKILILILPILFGIISLFLFATILEKKAPSLTLLAATLFALNPTTLYLYTASLTYSLAITLLLLSVFFLLKHKHLHALLILLVLPFVSITATFITFLLAAFFTLKKKLTLFFFLTLLLASLTLLISLYYPVFTLGLPELPRFSTPSFGLEFLKHNLLSDFGGAYGISLFILILSIFGIFISWKNIHTSLLLPFALFLIALFPQTIYFFTLPLAYFAAASILWLKNKNWRSDPLKKLVFLVLLCGILFSPLSYITRINTLYPTQSTIEAITFLQQQTGEDVVLSSSTNGIMINYAGKRNILDSHFLYAPQINQRWEDVQNIFHTSNIQEATTLLHRYQTAYIYIDRTMKQEIWTTDEEDLLFLLTYSPKLFGKIYQNQDTEIYLVY